MKTRVGIFCQCIMFIDLHGVHNVFSKEVREFEGACGRVWAVEQPKNHFGFALARMAEDKTKTCQDSMQVHEATSLGCVREQMVVKLVDIPTNIHDQCRQVSSPHMVLSIVRGSCDP